LAERSSAVASPRAASFTPVKDDCSGAAARPRTLARAPAGAARLAPSTAVLAAIANEKGEFEGSSLLASALWGAALPRVLLGSDAVTG
jgi:hypothetical protein